MEIRAGRVLSWGSPAAAGSEVAITRTAAAGHTPIATGRERTHSRPGRWVVGVAILGAMAAGIVMVVLANQAGVDQPGLRATLACWTTIPYIIAGAIAWRRRPDSRLGVWMIITGFVTFLAFLNWSSNPALFTLATAVQMGPPLMLLIVFLGYPTGRVSAPLDRAVIWAAAVAAALTPLYMALGYEARLLPTIVLETEMAEAIHDAQLLLMVAALVSGAFSIISRRVRDRRSLRRWFGYLVNSFSIVLLMLATLYLVHLTELTVATEPVRLTTFTLMGLAPIVFLVGLIDQRLARASVADLLAETIATPGPTELQEAVRKALRDPSARVVYWVPDFDTYADVDGKAVQLESETRWLTPVTSDDTPVAVLIHDPALADEPALLASVASATAMLIQKAQLEVELRARVEELRGSRIRILEAEQLERRRLERDLHDGAQQRLIALSLALGEIESMAEDEELRGRVDAARAEVAASLGELRNLAHGIHPAALIDHGLTVALESLATRAPVPVEVVTQSLDGVPRRVELTAFYLVSEALANIAKHARATSAEVEVCRDGALLVVEIRDDGVGGADIRAGSGLRGLADRVEAVGGTIRVWSPPGRGTRIRAEIPCGS